MSYMPIEDILHVYSVNHLTETRAEYKSGIWEFMVKFNLHMTVVSLQRKSDGWSPVSVNTIRETRSAWSVCKSKRMYIAAVVVFFFFFDLVSNINSQQR